VTSIFLIENKIKNINLYSGTFGGIIPKSSPRFPHRGYCKYQTAWMVSSVPQDMEGRR